MPETRRAVSGQVRNCTGSANDLRADAQRLGRAQVRHAYPSARPYWRS